MDIFRFIIGVLAILFISGFCAYDAKWFRLVAVILLFATMFMLMNAIDLLRALQ